MQVMEQAISDILGDGYTPEQRRYSVVHKGTAVRRTKEGWKVEGEYEGYDETLLIISTGLPQPELPEEPRPAMAPQAPAPKVAKPTPKPLSPPEPPAAKVTKPAAKPAAAASKPSGTGLFGKKAATKYKGKK